MNKTEYNAQYYARNREKIKERSLAHYEANKSEVRATHDEYHRNHPEVAKESSRKFRATHRELRAAQSLSWRKAKPDQFRALKKAASHRRRVRIAGGIVEKFLDAEIFERDNYICGICLDSIDPFLSYPDPMSVSLDHIVSISKGGSHTRDNVQAAHWRCNQRKGDR